MRHCVLCETRPYAWVIVYCEIGPCVWEQDLVSLFPVYDRALLHWFMGKIEPCYFFSAR